MTAQVTSSETGIVTLGIRVAPALRRKRKTTITTSAMLSAMVTCTSATEPRIVWVRSPRTRTLIDGGRLRCSSGSASFTSWTV